MIKLHNKDITNWIILFKNFLNSSMDPMYEAIDDLDWEEDGIFVHDWIQSNWEFLVERQLTQNKKTFSSLCMGDANLRISKPRAKFDYIVLARPNKTKVVKDLFKNKLINFDNKIRFYGLGAKQEIGFNICPPFDLCYLCDDRKREFYRAPLEDLTIYLEKVKK